MIALNEIKKYELYFLLDTNERIDSLKVIYYDEKDKEKIHTLIDFEKEMGLGHQELDNTWKKLNNYVLNFLII